MVALVTEHERDATRKRQKRQSERDLSIPRPKNLRRRRRCLKDPYRFLETYFGHIFWQDWTDDRREMIDAIVAAATFSGDQAIAGPRGDGKTRLALFVSLFCVLAGRLQFPLIIGKSGKRAEIELQTLKNELEYNDLLAADFPEVCIPIRELGGWAARARMQTAGGENTRIEWATDHIILPTISVETLRKKCGWKKTDDSLAGAQIIASMGIEGPLRGLNYRNVRPDLAILDDVDDRESAASPSQTETRERIIDQDVAGLAGPGRRISRLMMCTLINRTCVAATYTDPALKPSWTGKRFRWLIQPPDRTDLWDQYIQLRNNRDPEADPYAREAHEFYRANRKLMDAGAVVSNPDRFVRDPLPDGEPAELSSLQSYYNLVADIGAENVATEYDNNPPEEEQTRTSGLTSVTVASRLAGTERYVCPRETKALTLFVDLGKYRSHFTVLALLPNTAGIVIDYGVLHVAQANAIGADEAILATLREFRDKLAADPYVTEDGEPREIDQAGIDCGWWGKAVYEFVRESGRPWRPVMGVPAYQAKPRRRKGVRTGYEYYESYQPADRIWVVNTNVDYWKGRVHDGFQMPPRNDDGSLRSGSLTLWGDDPRTHRDSETGNYARQIMAEEWRQEPPKNGRPGKEGWYRIHDDNHYFDSTAGAQAMGALAGVVPIGAQSPRVAGNMKPGPKAGWFSQQRRR